MKSNTITHIKYTKATNHGTGTAGEVTERNVIFTFVPNDNLKALDVSDLSSNDQFQMTELYKEYSEFYKQQLKMIPSFENWAEQSKEIFLEAKWRTFKKDNIEVLD